MTGSIFDFARRFPVVCSATPKQHDDAFALPRPCSACVLLLLLWPSDPVTTRPFSPRVAHEQVGGAIYLVLPESAAHARRRRPRRRGRLERRRLACTRGRRHDGSGRGSPLRASCLGRYPSSSTTRTAWATGGSASGARLSGAAPAHSSRGCSGRGGCGGRRRRGAGSSGGRGISRQAAAARRWQHGRARRRARRSRRLGRAAARAVGGVVARVAALARAVECCQWVETCQCVRILSR
jgi:hypothetical protein